MHGFQVAPTIHPFPCHVCGVMVRIVTATTGELITINLTPDPDGRIIPWPAPTSTGLAQARRVDIPVRDGDMWSEHSCR